MDKFNIKVRVEELNKASAAYYNTGQPIMSDAEFDHKLNELRKLEEETGIILANSPTQNVGTVVLDGIEKITHKSPMLSLDKCHSTEEIIKFADGYNLVGSIKLDGLTVRLTYENGDLVLAESRGNGIEGGVITDHVKQFLNVPLHINKEGTYVIDGEALIKLDDFDNLNRNGEYKNSRNLASGTLASLDTSVVKDRKLCWYAWEVVEDQSSKNSFYLNLVNAMSLGFDAVPFIDVTTDNFNNLDNYINKFISMAKEMNLPQDGVVFKFDDVAYGKSLGNTSHHYRNGIAYKVFNDSVETTLRDIEWSSGKTGVLTPVAIFDTVDIEGSEVSRASLHNISVMQDIIGVTMWKGQKIGVYKANLIIPAVRWAEQYEHKKLSDDFEFESENELLMIPDKCPICGQSTKIVKENDSEFLVCTNPDCHGKLLGKLKHAVSRGALNIDGLSEATLSKFIDLGWLNSIKDIYHLSEHEKELKSLDGFGKKSVDKLLVSIEKSRNTSLERFLYSLSIPLLGKSASMMIADSIDYEFGEFVKVMVTPGAKHFKNISGIGDALIDSMDTYFNKYCSDVWELSKEFTFETPKSIMSGTTNELKGKTFVVTGSVNHYANRDALKADIEAHGGKVVGNVSSKTDYLINNDINSTSSKNQKAKSLGVPIISEDQFLAMIR